MEQFLSFFLAPIIIIILHSHFNQKLQRILLQKSSRYLMLMTDAAIKVL